MGSFLSPSYPKIPGRVSAKGPKKNWRFGGCHLREFPIPLSTCKAGAGTGQWSAAWEQTQDVYLCAPHTQSKTQGSDMAYKALHDLILLPLWPHPPLHRPPTFSPSDWCRERAWRLPWCRSSQPLSKAGRVKWGLGFSPVFSGREQNAQTKYTLFYFSLQHLTCSRHQVTFWIYCQFFPTRM